MVLSLMRVNQEMYIKMIQTGELDNTIPAEATELATGGFGPRLPLAPIMLPMWIPLGAAVSLLVITQGYA